MSMQETTRQHGLSLVELLLGLAITALVMAPLVPMLATASTAARIADEQATLERDADFVLERIAARIRATAPVADLRDKPVNDWLKPAIYSVNAAGALVEQQGTETYPLTEPGAVTDTDFTLSVPVTEASQPAIKISLTMKRGAASTTAAATIRMGTAL